MLASFGAFASNGEVKSNNGITSIKNDIEIKNELNKTLQLDIQMAVNCDSNIDTGLFVITIVWCC